MIEIGILGIVFALLWIGWEMHRMIARADEFMENFVEGYLEALRSKSGTTPEVE
jgi:hypothetical protein